MAKSDESNSKLPMLLDNYFFCVVFCILFFSFFFWPLYCLSYCTFSFGHYIVCPIVLFLLAIILSVLFDLRFWLPLWYLKMFLVINWVYIYHFLPTTGDPFIETRAPLPVLCSISPSTVIELWHVMLTNNSFCRFLRKI